MNQLAVLCIVACVWHAGVASAGNAPVQYLSTPDITMVSTDGPTVHKPVGIVAVAPTVVPTTPGE